MWSQFLRPAARTAAGMEPIVATTLAMGSIPYRQPARCDRGGNLHNLDPELQQKHLAKVPGMITSLQGDTPKVVSVVVTGGPCAGKSSCMAGLRREATLRGFNVILVPEVATVIMNSGFIPNADVASQFQIDILKIQHRFDTSFVRLAGSTRIPTLVIYDRGMMDGKAYTSSDEWNHCLSKVQHHDGTAYSEDDILEKYDMVVHLTTAADGAEQYYKHGFTTDDSGNSVYRREGPAEARAIDGRLKSAWSQHPRHVVIGNDDGGMKAKVQRVIEEVMGLCEHYHPQTRERNTKELRIRARDLELEIERLQHRVKELEEFHLDDVKPHRKR